MDLLGYLAKSFPGLTLEPALFYEWPIGIRFELNDEVQPEPDFNDIVTRATAIFSETFKPEDCVIAVSLKHPIAAMHPKRARDPKGLFEFANEYHLDFGPTLEHTSFPTEDGESTLEWSPVSDVWSSKIGTIFGAIANLDFGRMPRITDCVYFVNQSRDIILNMYDDRGLDVIAANRASLSHLYHTHTSWILGYDLPQVIHTFESH